MPISKMINRDSEILRPPFDVVAIAASLGGQKALIEVLASLPQNFDCPLIVIQHYVSTTQELFSTILRYRIRMMVRCATDGIRLRRKTVYTIAPGYYAVIDKRRVLRVHRMVQQPKPASMDLLFESMAANCGDRAIGVILTGSGSDGARGVECIKQAGGRVLVQDKSTSEYFGMPGAAIKTGAFDFILPLHKIAPALISLVMVHGAAELFKVPFSPSSNPIRSAPLTSPD